VQLSAASECSPVRYGTSRRGANSTFTAGEVPSRGALLRSSFCYVKFVRIFQGLTKDQSKLVSVSKMGAGAGAWGTGCTADLGHCALLQSALKKRCLHLLQGTNNVNAFEKIWKQQHSYVYVSISGY
jgi:hypothetical protein